MPELEDLMEMALPQIKKRFTATKRAVPWRNLFDVFETIKHDPAAGRARIVDVTSDTMKVAGLPADSSASMVTGRVIGATEVRTVKMINAADVKNIGHDSSVIDLDPWIANAELSAGLALYAQISPLSHQAVRVPAAADLSAIVALAREALHHLALDLVVSEHAWSQIVTKEEKKIGEALCGGRVVPVHLLGRQKGYVVPHQSGEVVIERLLEPTVTWRIYRGDGIRLIACEEFIVVRRRSLPSFGLTFSF